MTKLEIIDRPRELRDKICKIEDKITELDSRILPGSPKYDPDGIKGSNFDG